MPTKKTTKTEVKKRKTTETILVKDIAKEFQEKSGYEDLSLRQAEEDVRLICDIITEKLVNGKKVRLPDFNLTPKERKATRTRNPHTGEMMELPATKYIKADARSAMKAKMNPPDAKPAEGETAKAAKGKKK